MQSLIFVMTIAAFTHSALAATEESTGLDDHMFRQITLALKVIVQPTTSHPPGIIPY